MTRIAGSAIVALLLSLVSAHAEETAGKRVSNLCVACHGPVGVSNIPLWPNLAGQKKDYLIKQLKAFKNDERRDPLMSPIAKNLSDTDMEAVAEYFSTLKAQ